MEVEEGENTGDEGLFKTIENSGEKSQDVNVTNVNDSTCNPDDQVCKEKCTDSIEKDCCSADSRGCQESLNLANVVKSRSNPVVLEKIKDEPVKLLLDVPCSEKVKEQVDQYIKEKRERYIVDALHFYQDIIIKYNDHKAVLSTCSIDQWKMVPDKTRHYGLTAKFTFQCTNCLKTDHVFSESYEENVMDINTAVIAGTLATGIGHSQLEQIMGSLGVHCMSDKMYTERQSNVCQDTYEAATEKSMREAAEEEKRLAIANGDVTEDETPFITVIIDGSWLKRTYGSHWNSCSGAAAIIGARTKKVLFFDVRNKYCLRCARAANRGCYPTQHKCYKNWNNDQASTGMESDIILQGFKESITKYNLIYKTVVMDNDSNLYKVIHDSNVYIKYNIVPKRILCSVHLSKNACKNLRKAADSTQTLKKGQRGIGVARKLIKDKIGSMRLHLKEVIARRIKQKNDWQSKIQDLKKDIIDIPNVIFRKCHVSVQISGKKVIKTKNMIPLIQSFGLYDKVLKVFKDLSVNSESLLFNFTTNPAELLNALICRALGGKRVNWGLRNQYKTRVTTQVLQFNTGRCVSEFYKEKGKTVPDILTKLENKILAKVTATQNRRLRYGVVKGGRKRPAFDGNNSAHKFYGQKHEDVDISKDEMEKEMNARSQELHENQKNHLEIQKKTVDRANSHLWVSLQKKMLSSQHFGIVCTWKTSTSCATKVKKILYSSTDVRDEVEQFINEQDIDVKRIVSEIYKCKVSDCGLFIDDKFEFLCATPNALVGDDGILIAICPFEASNVAVEIAIQTLPKLKKIFNRNNFDCFNKKSEIYYEIQGCLNIAKKNHCYLVIKTTINYKIVKVDIDKDFWEDHMIKKLKYFFENCLLPEMIDSRHNRHMAIRDPPETLKFLEEKKKKSEVVLPKSNKRKIENLCQSEPGEKSDNECEYIGSYRIKRRRDEISNEWFRAFADNRTISYHHIRGILRMPYKWLDDDCLDRLIRIVNDQDHRPFDIQSVLYIERPECVQPVCRSSVQIIGGNCIAHWRTVYFDYGQKKVFVYDSLPEHTNNKLSRKEIDYLSKRFGMQLKSRDIAFVKMKTKQLDGSSCGLYAAAFAISLYFNEDPCNINYSTRPMELRNHFMRIISYHTLLRFPEMT